MPEPMDPLVRILSHFSGGGSCPVQYDATVAGKQYYVRYRHGAVTVDVDGAEAYARDIGGDRDGDWTDEETNVYLSLVSEAILAGEWSRLVLPLLSECRASRYFFKGPHPHQLVGFRCGVRTPGAIRQGGMNRHERRNRQRAGIHDHGGECEVWMPADEADAWIQGNPDMHTLMRHEWPQPWDAHARLQQTVVGPDNVRVWPRSRSATGWTTTG